MQDCDRNSCLPKVIYLFALLCYVALSQKFWFVNDDAFISFRYSKNFALGEGLRYNLANAVPVEGYSNFLWVVLGGAFEYLGLRIDFFLPLISSLCGLLLLHRLYIFCLTLNFSRLNSSLAVLLLACFPPFAVWSTSGLATMPYALLLFLTFENLIISRKPLRAGVYGLLLSLIRAEGLAWCLFLAGLHLLQSKFKSASLKETFFSYLPIVLSGFAIYFAWRFNYYGELLPNTVINKVGFNALVFERGIKYLLLYFSTFPVTLLIPFGMIAIYFIARQYVVSLVLLTAALLTYPIVVGGDFMTMFRFLVPLFVFQAILFAAILELFNRKNFSSNWGVIACSLLVVANILPAFNLHLLPKSLREQLHIRKNTSSFRSEYEQWEFMKNNSERWRNLGLGLKKLAKPDATLVAGAIGHIGYFSELHIYDRFGLIEPRVAKRDVRHMKSKSPGHDKAVPATFFLPDRPTYLKAYLMRDATPEMIADRARSFKNKQLYKDYSTRYVPLNKQDSIGRELGIFLVERIKK